MNKIICVLIFMAANASADQLETYPVTDEAPSHLPIVSIDAPWDTMGYFDCETPTGDNKCLGVEFDGTYFYVTGDGGIGGQPSSVHVFDANGIYIASHEQGTISSWRDIAWDGQYLYASDNSFVTQFYVDTLGVHVIDSFPGPENPNRAMAYDPATDHFWTANWNSPIYEFDRTGAVIDTFPNTPGYAIYGMAWDDVSVDGPWLWIYSQDGSPNLGLISQFDPINGVFTGLTYQGIGTSYAAGGCCFTTEWDTTLAVLFVLNQGIVDYVLGYEICSASGIEEENTIIKNHEFGPTILRGPLVLPKDKTCKVFDITGRVVAPDKIKPGIYFIEVDGVVTQKVVKVK